MQSVSFIFDQGAAGQARPRRPNWAASQADRAGVVLLDSGTCSPTVSSTFELQNARSAGIYDCWPSQRDWTLGAWCRARDCGLDLVLSKRRQGQLNTPVVHAPMGDFGCANLLPYPRHTTDCACGSNQQGARSVLT